MDNQAANRSSEEDYAEYQLQTKQTQQKRAVKQNTVINQKENENNGEKINDAEFNKDDSLNGATESDKKWIDPQKLPRYRYVNMTKARRLLSCEFCQGLMRKANVINPCIHRICGGCINDCIKLGKKECPICGTNYSAIVEDEKINSIVATMFPETEKIEPQASELPEKDEPCNKKKLIDDKNTRYKAKRSRCAMADSCSSMSELVTSSSKSPPEVEFELSDEMLDRVGKRVVAAILKQQKKHQQPPPNTNGKKKSKPEPNQQL